jgi:hypothetical protein
MTVCAIHQPNFFPWLGYFDKIKKADIFIFLDDVAYPKSGSGSGSWCNRVKLYTGSHQPEWFGIPIKREAGEQLIKEVCFSNKAYTLKKMSKTLAHSYQKNENYDAAMAWLLPLLCNPEMNLALYNMHVIQHFSAMLGLKTKFIKQSELTHSKQATELLIELVQQVGADAYLCGQGAGGYQQDALFEQENIDLVYQHDTPMQFDFLDALPKEERGLSIIHHFIAHYELLTNSALVDG